MGTFDGGLYQPPAFGEHQLELVFRAVAADWTAGCPVAVVVGNSTELFPQETADPANLPISEIAPCLAVERR